MEKKITKLFLVFVLCIWLTKAKEEMKEFVIECDQKETVTDTCDYSKDVFGDFRVKFISNKTIAKPEEVKTFVLKSTKLTYVPHGLDTIFINLETLTLSHSGLKFLSSDDFKGLKALKTLSLNNNNFTEVPKDIFKDNKNLETIDLSGNSIIKFNTHVFDGLEHLKSIKLDHSVCNTNQTDDAKIFIEELKKSKCNGGNILYLNSIILSLMTFVSLKNYF